MRENRVRSNFNRNEEFSYSDVPKHFESITDKSIHETKEYCLQSLSRKYKGEYKPQALQAMLQAINGEFEIAYAELEGDYGTRKSNLGIAYAEGIADIQEDIISFERQVDDYNRLYKQYADAIEKVTGERPDEGLVYGSEHIKSFKEQFNKLKENSNEN